MHISVMIRICEMLPGDPSSEEEDKTESESIITTEAEDRVRVENTESKSDSESREMFSLFTPKRRARAEICPTCSSHEI